VLQQQFEGNIWTWDGGSDWRLDKMCDGICDLWSKADWMGRVCSTL